MSDENSVPNIVFDRVDLTTCSMCGCDINVSGIDPFLQVECPDCGNMEPVPGRLGSFLLLELLGMGGMGGVYRAKDAALGRYVAIKVMLSSVGDDKDFVETFKREAQAAAKLNHPNIAQIYSFGQEKGQPYIVMELVDGKRFDEMVEESKSLDQGLVIKVGLDIASGLQAADEIGLIHGDIKPENILLDDKQNAKLVDFGIASFAHQGDANGIWGTPYYISPEKIKKQKVDARSDIYSLGATLFHALTKKPPFDGETPLEVVKARLDRPAPAVSKFRSNINPSISQIVSRMLQSEPSRRYPNYNSLMGDFRRALSEVGGVHSSKIVKKKGSKVVVSKRATSEQPTSSSSKAPSERRPAIRINKTRKAMAPSENKPRSAIAKYKNQQTKSQEPAQEKSGKGVWIFLFILLLLLVGTGIGFGLYIKDKKEKKMQAIIELAALNKQKEAGEQIYSQIEAVSSNVTALAGSGTELMESAAASVLAVTGEPFEAAAAKPPPRKEPEKKKEEAESGEENSELPPDMPSREEIDARRAGKDAESEEPEEEEQPLVDESNDEAPVKQLAKKVMSLAGILQENSETAKSIEAGAFPIKSSIDSARTSQQATVHVNEIQAELEKVQGLEKESTETLEKMEEAATEAESIKQRKEEEEAARQRAVEEEAARQRAEEEARRKAEEHAALVKNELELAEAARKANAPLVAQNKFEEALLEARQKVFDYKTDEGKAAAQQLVEIYERLNKLKLFLIENINKEPFRWGYGRGQAARDILSANEKGIQVYGINETIPWDELGAAQMLKIINKYLASRKVHIRPLCEAHLATALYCYENAGGNEAALNAARRYVQKAAELCEDLGEVAERLMDL